MYGGMFGRGPFPSGGTGRVVPGDGNGCIVAPFPGIGRAIGGVGRILPVSPLVGRFPGLVGPAGLAGRGARGSPFPAPGNFLPGP